MGMVIYNVVSGERPSRPPGPTEWLSDDVWDFISRCWSPLWDSRPDVNFAMNVLNDMADAIEVSRRELYATATDQDKGTSVVLRGRIVTGGQQLRTTDNPPLPSGSTGEEVEGQSMMPQNSQRVQGPVKQPPHTSGFPETFTVDLEPWEVDLVTFLRKCKTGIRVELEGERAQEFADELDAVRHSGSDCIWSSDRVPRLSIRKTSSRENESSI